MQRSVCSRMIHKFLTVFLYKLPQSSLFSVTSLFSRGLKLVQPMHLPNSSGSRKTGHEKCAAIKAETRWVSTERTMREARGDFHLQSFRSAWAEGKVCPGGWAVNQTPPKSLHMGNLAGRGSCFFLGRTSCEPWRLITIMGSGQFRWIKCLRVHFCFQTLNLFFNFFR